MQFIYQGRILSDGETAIIKTLDGITDVKPLDLRLDLRNSSPTGFSWGYLGSGPVQSAVAIIASALGEQYVDEFATTFAREVIASFTWDDQEPGIKWLIKTEQIIEWARAKRAGDTNLSWLPDCGAGIDRRKK